MGWKHAWRYVLMSGLGACSGPSQGLPHSGSLPAHSPMDVVPGSTATVQMPHHMAMGAHGPNHAADPGELEANLNMTPMTEALSDDGTPAAATPLQIGTEGYADPRFATEHFLGSGVCQMCHDGLHDSGGHDVSIVQAWAATMMANSSRDPLWQAKLSSELRRAPELAEALSAKCTRCHAPMANYEARERGRAEQLFPGALLDASDPEHAAAMDGVSCTLCHQIPDGQALGTPLGMSGAFELNGYAELYGPYADPLPMPMLRHTGYTPTYSPHMRSSALCASCHELKTPVVDASGTWVRGEEAGFPEQMPYSEWQASSFAARQSCQDCHMGRTDGVVLASRPPWLDTARDDFALHGFAGANQLMLELLRDHSARLGVTAGDFAPILQRTAEILANAARITLATNREQGQVLVVDVQVDNLAGHKLPTSFPSRRVVLSLLVQDPVGSTLFASGVLNADGRLPGIDDRGERDFEPHHREITRQDQAQIYETRIATVEGEPTWDLLRASHYLKDNRILPAGADKERLPADIQVAGAASTDDDFSAGRDRVRYRISNLPSGVPLTVTASLQYQTLSPAFAADLFTDRDDPWVGQFEQLYRQAKSKAVTLAVAKVTAP